MPKFTVHFMTAYCTWENVEAENEDEAIAQCEVPAEFDYCEAFHFCAIPEEDED